MCIRDRNKDLIKDEIKKTNFDNVDVISEENIKSQILSNSLFATNAKPYRFFTQEEK